MKIETRDAAPPVAPAQQSQRRNPGLLARAALTIALAVCLMVALTWALNTSNANARQVSTNLTQLQDQLDKPTEGAGQLTQRNGYSEKTQNQIPNDGPILEPVDRR